MNRRRLIVGSLAVVLACAAVTASPGDQSPSSSTPQTSPVFRGGVNYVLVDAYPQRAGKIVEGLTAADFQVSEDGKPQTIDAVEFVRVEARQPDAAYRDPNTLREMYAAAADPHARVFVVFLDTAHTAVDGSQRIRAPLVATLNSVIAPGDLFGVITQNQRPTDLTLQRRILSVEDQLARNWPWGMSQRVVSDHSDPMEETLSSCFKTLIPAIGTPPEPWLVADGAVMRTFDKVLTDRRREDRLLTSLSDLILHLGSIREARTVLMMITDGWVLYSPNRALENEPTRDMRFGSVATPQSPLFGQQAAQRLSATDNEFRACVGDLNRLAELDNQQRMRDVIALAQRNNVSIYPVSSAGLATVDTGVSEQTINNVRSTEPGGVLGQNMNRLNARIDSLKTLAENTDGIAVVNSNDLATGMKRIVDDVSAYYLIGYYTTNPKADGKFRKIDVKMKAPGVTVHARRGYVAADASARKTTAPGATDAAANSAPIEVALASLAREGGSTDVFIHGGVTGEDLAITVELGTRPMSSGDWAKGGKVTVDVASENGAKVGSGTGIIDPGMRSTLVRISVGTAAGPWKVTAKAASGLSSISDGVSLAGSRGALLGDPVVSRATPSPRSPLLPVANFEFRRNERVHIEWLTLKMLDDRTARVLDRKGQPLPLGAASTEREADGKTSVAVDVNLAPLAEGDYVIELTATSGAERERKLVAVRVVR